jgi:hypothetical protein
MAVAYQQALVRVAAGPESLTFEQWLNDGGSFHPGQRGLLLRLLSILLKF